MNSLPQVPQKIPGFEATAYAYLDGEVVWLGEPAGTEHPRNARTHWQPPRIECDAQRLAAGAQTCKQWIDGLPPKGLLRWLTGQPMAFPIEQARARFDAIREALVRNDLLAFATAAERVLGLGHGLTPSGDDFVGGIFFALAHAPREAWEAELPAVRQRMRAAAGRLTNVISAALLSDLMKGASYAPLHALLAALQDNAQPAITHSAQRLLRVGATSGADMLAGLLLALLTLPTKTSPPTVIA